MVFLRRYKRTVRAPVNASNIRRLEKYPVHQFQNKIYVGYVFSLRIHLWLSLIAVHYLLIILRRFISFWCYHLASDRFRGTVAQIYTVLDSYWD